MKRVLFPVWIWPSGVMTHSGTMFVGAAVTFLNFSIITLLDTDGNSGKLRFGAILLYWDSQFNVPNYRGLSSIFL